MNAYLTATPVTLVLPLPAGVTALEYRVTDQAGVELVARIAVAGFVASSTEVSITTAAAVNTLQAGAVRGVRTIELYITTASGTFIEAHEYLVEAEETLVEFVNSYQTYGNAVMLSYDIPSLPGWNNATRRERTAALIAARRNIGALRFRYTFDTNLEVVDPSVAYSDLTLVTQSQWEALPTDFREAVKRAQVLEADFLLGGDPIGDLRRSGVVSNTVGETSQFFGTKKPVERAVCKRAMKELAKYVQTKIRLGRG